MKIIQEKSVYEDGEKFYCIYFDDETYVCLTEEEYHDLLKIIENGSQSDLNKFIGNSSAQNISNLSSTADIGYIGFFLSIILGIGLIYLFVKIWYSLPLIIGIATLIMGLISLIIGGIINHKFPHFLWAILYSIGGAIIFSINMFFCYLCHIWDI